MSDKEETSKEVPIRIPKGATANTKNQNRIRTERYERIYANNFAIEFSTFDTSIIFGEILGEQDGKPVIEEITHITMSRELLKTMTAVILQNIKGFEQQFGEIKIPVFETETSVVREENDIEPKADTPPESVS